MWIYLLASHAQGYSMGRDNKVLGGREEVAAKHLNNSSFFLAV